MYASLHTQYSIQYGRVGTVATSHIHAGAGPRLELEETNTATTTSQHSSQIDLCHEEVQQTRIYSRAGLLHVLLHFLYTVVGACTHSPAAQCSRSHARDRCCVTYAYRRGCALPCVLGVLKSPCKSLHSSFLFLALSPFVLFVQLPIVLFFLHQRQTVAMASLLKGSGTLANTVRSLTFNGARACKYCWSRH